MTTRAKRTGKFLLAGAMAALLVSAGSSMASAEPTSTTEPSAVKAAVAAPNWPGGECVLSDPHLVFDDENASNPKASMSWNPSTSAPVDPDNSNFHLRSTSIGVSNLSNHTYYETTYFPSWLYLRENGTNKHNYAAWSSSLNLFDTQVPPQYPWASGWQPRDPGTPGAQATLIPGTAAGNPLAATIIDPNALGKTSIGAGTTRPGYILPDIAAGANQGFIQVMRVERPTNNGAYASLTYRVISVKTCLPIPTIAQPTEGDATLSGTGTTVGDAITVKDQDGNVLGTAVVQSDLTWTLDLGSPLDTNVRELTATAVDEFNFEGVAETTVTPRPAVPTLTNPTSVSLSCTGDAVFTTKVTTGTPDPVVKWEQSTDGGQSWTPAQGTASSDGQMLTVSAKEADDGTRYRAVASNSAGTATSETALLTVAACLTEVTPAVPQISDSTECGVSQTVQIPGVQGVTYTREDSGRIVRVTARAAEGYKLAAGSQSAWEFRISAPTKCATPSALPARGSTLAQTGSDWMTPLAATGGFLLAAGVALLWRRRIAL